MSQSVLTQKLSPIMWVIGLFGLALLSTLVSCGNDDDPGTNTPTSISFAQDSYSISEDSSAPVTVELSLESATQAEGTVTISIATSSTALSSDFSTTPSVSDDQITLRVAKGAMSASFSVSSIDNSDNVGDRAIHFELISSTGGLEVSSSNNTTIVLINEDDHEASFDLIFEEDFDYGSSSGDITSLSDWERYSGEEVPIQYSPVGLSFVDYPASEGGAIEVVNGPETREDIQIDFTAQTEGVLYSAQLIKAVSASTDGEYFYALTNEGSGFFNRIFAQDDGFGKLLLGTALNLGGGGSESYSASTYDYNTTYLIVVKYDFTAMVTSMYVVDGSIPSTEPSVPDAQANTGDLPTSLDGIRYRQNKGSLAVAVDGIRVGSSWKDVLGVAD